VQVSNPVSQIIRYWPPETCTHHAKLSLKGEVEVRKLLLEVRDERNGGLLTGYTNFPGFD